jgi:hypothetical protein
MNMLGITQTDGIFEQKRRPANSCLPKIARMVYRVIATGALLAAISFNGLYGAWLAQPPSKALALSWTGYADTDLRFSEFMGSDHTLALRFMPQFPNGYEGPIIAENGSGNFFLGQGDYLAGTPGQKLMVTVGSKSLSFGVILQAGQWHHLALVATHDSLERYFTLYLDGARYGQLVLSPSDPLMPSGTLRFGKRTAGQTVNSRNAQFYGLLDDVAVFNRALTASEIQNLSSNVLQITGSESGLLAGYSFNDGSQPASLGRPLTLKGAASRVQVSIDRNNAVDASAMPLPTQQVEMTLPFPPGEAWQVIQGVDDPSGSHKGYASFCWDFIIAGQPQKGLYPNGTNGAPFYAAAPGSVANVFQSSTSGDKDSKGNVIPPNKIEIQQAPGEIAAYLHLPQNGSAVATGNAIARGEFLAVAGDTGVPAGAYHLHFSVTNQLDQTTGFVTFPIAFSNYEVRDANGNWNRVMRGMPANGQVIRIPPEPGARWDARWRPSTITYTTATGNHVIYSFVQGVNHHLFVNYWDGGSWHWADQGPPPDANAVNDPSAVTIYHGGTQLIYAFATADNGHLVANYWDGSSWKWTDQYLPPGVTSVSSPSAIAYGNDSIYVFATANNGHLVVNYWNGSIWQWADQQLPDRASAVYAPSAVTSGGNIYVFGQANNGDLVVNYWNGSSWQWADQGIPAAAKAIFFPNAIAFGGHLYVFATADTGHLVVNYWDGSSWQWADQGLPSGISAVFWPSAITYANGMYVFGTASNGHLVVNYFDGAWHWADQGLKWSNAMSYPNAITFGSAGIYVFGVGTSDTSNYLLIDYWNGNSWVWSDQGPL